MSSFFLSFFWGGGGGGGAEGANIFAVLDFTTVGCDTRYVCFCFAGAIDALLGIALLPLWFSVGSLLVVVCFLLGFRVFVRLSACVCCPGAMMPSCIEAGREGRGSA